MDEGYRILRDRKCVKMDEMLTTPHTMRLKLSCNSVAKALKERFDEKYNDFEITQEFIDYMSTLDRSEEEVNRAYNIMYNLQCATDSKEFDRTFYRTFAKLMELLQSQMINFEEDKKASIIQEVRQEML